MNKSDNSSDGENPAASNVQCTGEPQLNGNVIDNVSGQHNEPGYVYWLDFSTCEMNRKPVIVIAIDMSIFLNCKAKENDRIDYESVIFKRVVVTHTMLLANFLIQFFFD